MKRLESVGGLAVSQQKEWGEILSGFEGRNKYVVSDDGGNELFYAVEETGSVVARIFLKAFRPFSIYVVDAGGETLLRIERPEDLRRLRQAGWKSGKEVFGSSAHLLDTLPRWKTTL